MKVSKNQLKTVIKILEKERKKYEDGHQVSPADNKTINELDYCASFVKALYLEYERRLDQKSLF